jgi:hypothetical protein
VVAFGGNVLLTVCLVVLHGSGVLGWTFGAFVVLTAVMTWWAGPPVGAASALYGWLFFDGFIVGRQAHLAWHGVIDLDRILVLAGTALAIGLLRAVVLRPARHQRNPPRALPALDGNTSPESVSRPQPAGYRDVSG